MTVQETLVHLEAFPYLTVELRRYGNRILLATWQETTPGDWLLDWLEHHADLPAEAPWLLKTGRFGPDEYFADRIT